MRKFVISLAAAGAALAFASPAAAQYWPGQGYGNGGQSYGYGYGYNNSGQVRALQARIDAVEHQIRYLDRRDVIRDRSADRLREEAQGIERRLHGAARYGLNPYEASDIQNRIAMLESRVRYAMANRYGGYGYNGYGSNGYGYGAQPYGNNGYGYNGQYGRHDGDYDRDGDGDRDGDRDPD